MSTCDRKDCILRLKRIAVSAELLAKDMERNDWHDNVSSAAQRIASDATLVSESINRDTSWAASDR